MSLSVDQDAPGCTWTQRLLPPGGYGMEGTTFQHFSCGGCLYHYCFQQRCHEDKGTGPDTPSTVLDGLYSHSSSAGEAFRQVPQELFELPIGGRRTSQEMMHWRSSFESLWHGVADCGLELTRRVCSEVAKQNVAKVRPIRVWLAFSRSCRSQGSLTFDREGISTMCGLLMHCMARGGVGQLV